jgi:CheY-like chemotaxis protein
MLLVPDILARLAIAEYLRACGYRVIEGVRSEEVFTVLEAKTPVNIILAEARLSGELDGLALARKVREQYSDIEIYVTAGIANIAEKATQLCESGPLKMISQPHDLIRRVQLLRERQRTQSGA